MRAQSRLTDPVAKIIFERESSYPVSARTGGRRLPGHAGKSGKSHLRGRPSSISKQLRGSRYDSKGEAGISFSRFTDVNTSAEKGNNIVGEVSCFSGRIRGVIFAM
jgi:hypothetical protein